MLNVYAAWVSESFKENQLLSRSAGAGFTSMWQDEGFEPGFEGQNKGKMDEKLQVKGPTVNPALPHPQLAESSNISIIFQCTVQKCNVPLLISAWHYQTSGGTLCCSCTAPSNVVRYCWPACQQQYRLQKCLPNDQEDDSASVYSPSHLTHYLPIAKKQGIGGGLMQGL